jgi:hypothetical protein
MGTEPIAIRSDLRANGRRRSRTDDLRDGATAPIRMGSERCYLPLAMQKVVGKKAPQTVEPMMSAISSGDVRSRRMERIGRSSGSSLAAAASSSPGTGRQRLVALCHAANRLGDRKSARPCRATHRPPAMAAGTVRMSSANAEYRITAGAPATDLMRRQSVVRPRRAGGSPGSPRRGCTGEERGELCGTRRRPHHD